MDELIQQLFSDPWGRLVLQHLLGGGLKSGFLFVLVAARLSGVLLVAPYFLSTIVPASVRTGLVIVLSLVITQALTGAASAEGSVSLVVYQTVVSGGLLAADFVGLILNEIAIGTLLGIGILTVLSGLRMGGDWLDRQTGLCVGSMMNSDVEQSPSQGNSLVQLLGVAMFLTLKPVSGIVLLLRSLVGSFQDIPVGSASWVMSLDRIVGDVVQQSFVLGLQIAIPLVAAMTLIDLALSFVNRDTSLPFGPHCLVIRTCLSMMILALTTTMLPDVIASASWSMFESLRGVR